MNTAFPHLYTDLSPWWPLLSRPEDYEEEAGIFTRVVQSALPSARTMLELGSGGGNNASFLKQHFEMTLVDRAPGMLAVSQKLNPDLPHIEGDMRSVRLGRVFDVVFIHDAIMYMTSEEDLARAIQTAAVHTRPGGAALFVPDYVKETFRPSTSHGGHDYDERFAPEYAGRALRYLEWTYDPDPSDTTVISDFTYLLKTGEQAVQCVYDRHVTGLFPRDTWLRLMVEAGYQPRVLPFEHSEVAPGETEMFLGMK